MNSLNINHPYIRLTDATTKELILINKNFIVLVTPIEVSTDDLIVQTKRCTAIKLIDGSTTTVNDNPTDVAKMIMQ